MEVDWGVAEDTVAFGAGRTYSNNTEIGVVIDAFVVKQAGLHRSVKIVRAASVDASEKFADGSIERKIDLSNEFLHKRDEAGYDGFAEMLGSVGVEVSKKGYSKSLEQSYKRGFYKQWRMQGAWHIMVKPGSVAVRSALIGDSCSEHARYKLRIAQKLELCRESIYFYFEAMTKIKVLCKKRAHVRLVNDSIPKSVAGPKSRESEQMAQIRTFQACTRDLVYRKV